MISFWSLYVLLFIVFVNIQKKIVSVFVSEIGLHYFLCITSMCFSIFLQALKDRLEVFPPLNKIQANINNFEIIYLLSATENSGIKLSISGISK